MEPGIIAYQILETIVSARKHLNICPLRIPVYLYAKQKKRHRCTEKTFGLCGRRWGWDVVREQHRNMYIIKCETDRQLRLDAWDKCLGLVHWEDPEGSGGEGGGREDQDGEYM